VSGRSVDAELAEILRSCAVRRLWAEQEEGPYHRDSAPRRRHIAEDRDGAPLQVGLRILGVDGNAVSSATVELWHCDALGRYSGFPPPSVSDESLGNATFLRGRQAADDAGMVEFRTIYPGWYPGRTVHIHQKVHTKPTTLTSQLYFPDDVSSTVLAQAPYAARPGRDTFNHTDTIFPTGGEPALLEVSSTAAGRRAALSLVLPEDSS
jgi:protocatechuate 3,4-dioxygenase beta subunit